MKLTTEHIRQLIREELSKVKEANIGLQTFSQADMEKIRQDYQNKIRNQAYFLRRLLALEELLRKIQHPNLKSHHQMIQKYLKSIKQDKSYQSNKTAPKIGIYHNIPFSDSKSGLGYIKGESKEQMLQFVKSITSFIMNEKNFDGNNHVSDLKASGKPFDVTEFRDLNKLANELDFKTMAQKAAEKNPNPTLVPGNNRPRRRRTLGVSE